MRKSFLILFVLVLTFSIFPVTDASGSELIFGLGEEPENIDPHQATGWQEYMLLSFIVEPLFTLDQNYEIVPLLARDYQISDDGLEMDIWLRKGIKFHTGEEMTASDVRKKFPDNNPPYYSQYYCAHDRVYHSIYSQRYFMGCRSQLFGAGSSAPNTRMGSFNC